MSDLPLADRCRNFLGAKTEGHVEACLPEVESFRVCFEVEPLRINIEAARISVPDLLEQCHCVKQQNAV